MIIVVKRYFRGHNQQLKELMQFAKENYCLQIRCLSQPNDVNSLCVLLLGEEKTKFIAVAADAGAGGATNTVSLLLQ